MDTKRINQPTCVSLLALDWETLGQVVHEHAAAAIALHVANLGDTDNPATQTTGRRIASTDSNALNLSSRGKFDFSGLDGRAPLAAMEFRP